MLWLIVPPWSWSLEHHTYSAYQTKAAVNPSATQPTTGEYAVTIRQRNMKAVTTKPAKSAVANIASLWLVFPCSPFQSFVQWSLKKVIMLDARPADASAKEEKEPTDAEE